MVPQLETLNFGKMFVQRYRKRCLPNLLVLLRTPQILAMSLQVANAYGQSPTGVRMIKSKTL